MRRLLGRSLLSTLALLLAATSVAPFASAALDNSGNFTNGTCGQKILWGRPECEGFFTGAKGADATRTEVLNDGALLGASDKNSFIDEIYNRLFVSGNLQDNVGSAGIVAVMLQKNGPDFGNNRNTGIKFARDNFNAWKSVVDYYDSNNLIRWNYIWTPGANAYSDTGYSEEKQDFFSKTFNYDDSFLTIRFSVPAGGTGQPFMLNKYCANMVGQNTFPKQKQFSFQGNTTVDGNDQSNGGNYVTGSKTISVTPGSTVTFNHTIKNTGGSSGTANYTTKAVDPAGNVTNTPPKVTNPSRPNPGSLTIGAGQTEIVNTNKFTIPASATPGQKYCQYVVYNPISDQNGNNGGGPGIQACVIVAYNYNLVPASSVSETLGTTGSTVTFTYNVNNSGQTTSKSDTSWTIQQIVVSPGKSLPNNNATYTDGGDCAQYVAPGITCQQIQGGSTQPFGPGNTSINANPGATSLTLNGYPAGTKICRILTVDPPTQNNNPRKRWSTPTCVTVGKYPTVHFMSGDISVGGAYPDAAGTCTQRPNSGNIFTATNSNTSGSVDEYAAFARGTINYSGGTKKGFGTRSLTATESQRISAWSLAFANTSSPPGNLGDVPHCMNDYYAKFSPQSPAIAAPNPVDLSAINATIVHYNGDITIQASNIPAGKNLIVVVDGNVTIADNITYPGSYGSTADIPSIAIVARGNITVNDNVTRLDGSYFTKKTFATCQTAASLSTNICNKQLVVNGAVYTDKIQLSRTFGADPAAGSEPAERFIYGVELLYNNVLEPASDGTRIDVINEQDLPARY